MNGQPALLSGATVFRSDGFSERRFFGATVFRSDGGGVAESSVADKRVEKEPGVCIRFVQGVENIEASSRGVMKMFFRVAREGTR